jgi:hypothetical protein
MLKVCFCAKQVDAGFDGQSSDFDVKKRFSKNLRLKGNHLFASKIGAGVEFAVIDL